ERDDALVVRVRGALARALTVEGGDRAEAAALREQAIAGARRLGDPRALGQALVRAYWAKGDASRGEVLAALTEARDLGAELGDVELRAEAMGWRTVTLAAAGRVAEAHAEAAALREAAGRARQPFMLHAAEQFTSALRLCAGDLDGAEAAARRSREWRRALHEPLADGAFGLQMFAIERERGTLGSLVPAAVVRAAATDAGGRWEPGRIALLAELGLIADARAALAALVASAGADAVPPDALGLAGATYLAEVAALVGDLRAAALLERRLAPLAGELVVVGHLVACQGAADRFLGILAAVGGREDEAEARLRAALALDRRTGPTWTAHSALALAELLERRDGDGAEALALRREARALAEAHGLGRVVRRLGARAAVPAPADELPAGLSPREVVILRRLADGRTNREIGAALVISQHTVANHVRSILRKTGSANRAEAVSFAHRHGLAP
ncbi:MAG TPA: LuxR C-terminal-related transcriptional regulator, partial [Solirubrobacteraceae bacterium]|nr:LuxR C-terminal-related transcriptional regulator [Solirubrobacteraceae bacterium]